MKEDVESGIRIKAILIYVVFAIVCGILIAFVYNMRKNIDDQKENIEEYNRILTLTNDLVFTVNEAQTEATLYISTKRNTNLRKFREKVSTVELLVDSLVLISDETVNDSLVNQVSKLLKNKGRIISELNKQFDRQQVVPRDTLIEKFNIAETTLGVDTMLVTTVVKDTVISRPPSRKSFWGRLSDAFSPSKSADTVVNVYRHVSDTLHLTSGDKENLISEVSDIAEKINTDYSNRLKAVERQVTRLIYNDQAINIQLSALLNSLSRDAMDATFNEILQREQLVRDSYHFSVYGGALAFLLSLLLIFLILNDVNKGKAARKALRQVMETRRQLLLSVSHDIKSPLSSILGTVDLWKRNKMVPETQTRMLENSGRYIFALLNNLLEFSNMEQGELNLSENNFNLRAFSVEIVTMFEPLAQRKNLSLDYDFQITSPADICADELKMKQIIINILSNAVKYTKKGGIRFVVKYEKRRVFFQISDTGAGIPKEDIPDLFLPFKRIERNNNLASGSGLGMYVVKELIHLLYGEIHVDSKVGEGTTIEVILPVKQVKEEKVSRLPEKILVLDDDESVLMVMKEMLSHVGCEVEVSALPEYFGTTLLPENYDMIITDMEMGEISGLDVLRKSKERAENTSVVIMTGQSNYSRDKATQDGFDFYLPKPVNRFMLNRLFGIKEENKTEEFQSLEEMFGNDPDTLQEILEAFLSTLQDNIQRLQVAVDSDDFTLAQAVCHKLLPLFLQLGIESSVEVLQWMDSLRGHTGEDHPEWKSKVRILLQHAKEQYDNMKKLKDQKK
ncbi:MAG: hybrid sensor histidine kinase/response regulator [Bacteroidales bacterium]|nr:hybrid sensor histidine kinase/response regulator [Bacteroidales bacterium]